MAMIKKGLLLLSILLMSGWVAGVLLTRTSLPMHTLPVLSLIVFMRYLMTPDAENTA